MLCLAYACVVVAVVPLAAVLLYVIVKGAGAWDREFFTGLPTLFGSGGGVANGIVGTLITVALASAIGIPFGVMAGIYLSEYGRGWLGALIRFVADTMTGIPSIVAGIFVYGLVVLNLGGYSGFAGALSLAILMIPVIARSTEGVVRLVPDSIREASLALGVPRWKTTLRVVVPAALGGILTGILLSVARVAGETAPLLFTAFGSDYFNLDPFKGPMPELPIQIYNAARSAYPGVIQVGWGAALLLVLMVLVANLTARVIFRGRGTGAGF
ncbi:phosphate ABC transporter permease PstA [Rubrobacter calidifluminis]|uniref:phosphate ABC transporter permease PstA n=1 Tax=Rubrobacter calidifluminis TaxID=1392640 RepID=UPI0023630C3D|nr:phosphate ABC transporter permease PstA [Rubrobacter calidifluminis]